MVYNLRWLLSRFELQRPFFTGQGIDKVPKRKKRKISWQFLFRDVTSICMLAINQQMTSYAQTLMESKVLTLFLFLSHSLTPFCWWLKITYLLLGFNFSLDLTLCKLSVEGWRVFIFRSYLVWIQEMNVCDEASVLCNSLEIWAGRSCDSMRNSEVLLARLSWVYEWKKKLESLDYFHGIRDKPSLMYWGLIL